MQQLSKRTASHRPARTLLTVPQAAHLFEIQPRTFQRWIANCELPAVRVDGQWHFFEEDLLVSLAFNIFCARHVRAHGQCFGAWKK